MIAFKNLDAFEPMVGGAAQLSGYRTIGQDEIDAFANLCGDRQWIHVDRERAARESPYGGTIAHGFYTIGIMSLLFSECFTFPNRKTGLNYGFDRLRFVSAVPSGARVRGRFMLEALKRVAPDTVECMWDASIEIEGSYKPAIAAKWLTRATY